MTALSAKLGGKTYEGKTYEELKAEGK